MASLLTTIAAQITPQGITAPEYADILAFLQTKAQGIFGADIDLDPDSADGQMLAVYALAQKLANDSVMAAYNAYSPAAAVAAGLSSIVKINGIARLASSASSADLTIVGV